jgi:RNase P subunit RPR2
MLEKGNEKVGMICDKCRAGQMLQYEKSFSSDGKSAKILGSKCERCGHIKLANDEDIWSIVGL